MADAKGVLTLEGDPNKAILSIERMMKTWTDSMTKMQGSLEEVNKRGKSFTANMERGIDSMVRKYTSVAAIVGIIQQASAAQREFSQEVLKTSTAIDEQLRKAAAAAGLSSMPKDMLGDISKAALSAHVPIGAAAAAQVQLGLSPEAIKGGTLADALKLQTIAGGQMDLDSLKNILTAQGKGVTSQSIRELGGKAVSIFGTGEVSKRLPGFMQVVGAGQEAGLTPAETMAAEQTLIESGAGGRRPEGTLTGLLDRLATLPGDTLEDKLGRISARAGRMSAPRAAAYWEKQTGAGRAARVLAENMGRIRQRAASAGGAEAFDQMSGLFTTGLSAEEQNVRTRTEVIQANDPEMVAQARRESRLNLVMSERGVAPGLRKPISGALSTYEFLHGAQEAAGPIAKSNPLTLPAVMLDKALWALVKRLDDNTAAIREDTAAAKSSPARGSN